MIIQDLSYLENDLEDLAVVTGGIFDASAEINFNLNLPFTLANTFSTTELSSATTQSGSALATNSNTGGNLSNSISVNVG
jgi:hypothetical protein